MSKRDGKERMREMRALLMDWDALGVADVPEAADEYDCMIGPLHGHLHRGGGARSLRDVIERERSDHFGLHPDTRADSALADALVEWWTARSSRQ
ncbi:hypothetical protein [Cellulomonas hominis]|uniref:hypothetical protein n=1 Tax=Cellulomonas hominis TaxID=156981 RepID=UPI001BCC0C06|nr:hypothetical protein [Cellulomonas hominis]